MPIERIKELSRNNRLISAFRTKRKMLHDAYIFLGWLRVPAPMVP